MYFKNFSRLLGVGPLPPCLRHCIAIAEACVTLCDSMAGRCDVRYFREKSGDERREAKYEPLVLTLYHSWAMKNGQKTTRKLRPTARLTGNRDRRPDVEASEGRQAARSTAWSDG